MPRHADLDFPHRPVHCADCWDDQQRGHMLTELRRANDLKEKELDSLADLEYRPQRAYVPKQPYIPPPPPRTLQRKGGMNIVPTAE